METYRIVTEGNTGAGHTKSDVTSRLLIAKVPPTMVDKIFSGEKVILKKHLSWADAQSFHNKIQQLGLDAKLALELNPTAFELGFTPLRADSSVDPDLATDTKTSSRQNSIETEKKLKRWIFYGNLLVSKLLSTTGMEAIILDDGRRKIGTLSSNSHYWNPIFLLSAILIISVGLQSYLVRIMVIYFGWSTFATFIGVMALVILPLTFARFIQPRSILSLALTSKSNASDVESLHLEEQPRYFLGKKNYLIYSDSFEPQGEIIREHNKAKLISATGALLYLWDKHVDVDEQRADAEENLRDIYTDDTALGQLMDSIGWLRLFKRLISRKPKLEKLVFHPRESEAICDSSGKLVAVYYLSPVPAIEFIDPEMNAEERLKIALFSLTLIRAAWL